MLLILPYPEAAPCLPPSWFIPTDYCHNPFAWRSDGNRKLVLRDCVGAGAIRIIRFESSYQGLLSCGPLSRYAALTVVQRHKANNGLQHSSQIFSPTSSPNGVIVRRADVDLVRCRIRADHAILEVGVVPIV